MANQTQTIEPVFRLSKNSMSANLAMSLLTDRWCLFLMQFPAGATNVARSGRTSELRPGEPQGIAGVAVNFSNS